MTAADPDRTLFRERSWMLHSGRINRCCAGPWRGANIKDNVVRPSKLDLNMRRWRHVFQRRDFRRAKRLQVLCPIVEVIDHDAKMVKTTIVNANSGLILPEFDNADTDKAIRQDDA